MDEAKKRGQAAIAEQVRQTPGDRNEISLQVCANVGTTGLTPRADVTQPDWPSLGGEFDDALYRGEN